MPATRIDERLLQVYIALAPILVLRGGSGQALGIVDLLAPIGLFILLTTRTRSHSIHASLLWLFVACLSFSTVYLYLRGQYHVTESDLLRIFRLVAIFIPFLLVLRLEQFDRNSALRAMRIFLWSGSIACVIGISLFTLNIQMRDSQQLNWQDGEASLRAGGLLGNSSDFGHLAAILAAVAVGYKVLNASAGYAYLVPFGLSCYAIYASSSRAALLHLAIALLFLLPLMIQSRKVVFALFSVPVAFGLLSANWGSLKHLLGSSTFSQRLDVFNVSGSSAFYTSNARLNTWERSWEFFSDSPFFGIGYNGILRETSRSGDNSFISLFTEGGIFAGGAYVIFWFAILITVMRATDLRTRMVGLSLVIAELAQMLTVDTHRLVTTTPVALAMIACLVRLANEGSNSGNSSSSGEPESRLSPPARTPLLDVPQ